MIGILRRNPVIAALGAMCLLLLVLVAFELATGVGSSRPVPPRRAVAAEAKLLPPVAVASAEAYPETVARPLWIPTRRPAPPPAAAVASIPRGQYMLQGVIIAGDMRIAMLREKASGRVHRVEKGKELNGLTIAEVEPESVTLSQGTDREVVELRVQKGGPVSATAASAPGAPSASPPGATAPVASQGPFTPPTRSSPPQPPVPGTQAPVPAPQGVPVPAPPTAVPQATTAPMTPEELLARRRARRTQTP